MKKTAFLLAIMTFLLWICALASASELPPIPAMPEKFKDIQIAKPNPSISKDITGFLGEWEGVWKYVGDMVSHNLGYGAEWRKARIIVYEVSPEKVKFLYGCGESPNSAGVKGWSRHVSDINEINGKKSFSRRAGDGFRMSAYLENGLLKVTNGRNLEGELRRIK